MYSSNYEQFQSTDITIPILHSTLVHYSAKSSLPKIVLATLTISYFPKTTVAL